MKGEAQLFFAFIREKGDSLKPYTGRAHFNSVKFLKTHP